MGADFDQRRLFASRAAREINEGFYANLGIGAHTCLGLPTSRHLRVVVAERGWRGVVLL